MSKKGLFVRLTEEEAKILEAYSQQSGRTKSDVIRAYVRQLKKKLKQNDREAT